MRPRIVVEFDSDSFCVRRPSDGVDGCDVGPGSLPSVVSGPDAKRFLVDDPAVAIPAAVFGPFERFLLPFSLFALSLTSFAGAIGYYILFFRDRVQLDSRCFLPLDESDVLYRVVQTLMIAGQATYSLTLAAVGTVHCIYCPGFFSLLTGYIVYFCRRNWLLVGGRVVQTAAALFVQGPSALLDLVTLIVVLVALPPADLYLAVRRPAWRRGWQALYLGVALTLFTAFFESKVSARTCASADGDAGHETILVFVMSSISTALEVLVLSRVVKIARRKVSNFERPSVDFASNRRFVKLVHDKAHEEPLLDAAS